MRNILGGNGRSARRLFLLDCDGTLQATSNQDSRPSAMVLDVLSALCRDERNTVFVISGRGRKDLEDWLGSVVGPLHQPIVCWAG
jgi:trehalose 6-phosphate synthase/phosphatase